MPMPVIGSYGRPIGCSSKAMGGAAEGMGINALDGESEFITTFDDFNDPMILTEVDAASVADGTTNLFEECGWTMVGVNTGATAVSVDIGDPNVVAKHHASSMRMLCGDAEDEGGNMQLDILASTNHGVANLGSDALSDTVLGGHRQFPHIYIPEVDIGAAVLDNTSWMFACRLGLRADVDAVGGGAWDSKCFIGWAETGDPSILEFDGDTPFIIQPETGPLIGFHVREDGSIRGVAQRTVNTAFAEGTNLETLVAAGGVDGTVANGVQTAGDTVWFDLALRMDYADISETTGNGTVTFYHRRVPTINGAAGFTDSDQSSANFNWTRHGSVLTDQCPNNDEALVPTIEWINGPTGNTDGVVYLDWWAMGMTRPSRL